MLHRSRTAALPPVTFGISGRIGAFTLLLLLLLLLLLCTTAVAHDLVQSHWARAAFVTDSIIRCDCSCKARHTSHATTHTSHVTHHTSHVTYHTLQLRHHTSHRHHMPLQSSSRRLLQHGALPPSQSPLPADILALFYRACGNQE